MASKRGYKLEEPEDNIVDDNEKMKMFSIRVATAHTFVKTIFVCVERLHQIKEQIQITVGTDKEKILSKEIDENISNVQNNQQKMKIILDQLQEAINEAKLEDKVYKCFFLYSI
jgi:uncharacterized protein YpmB